MERITAANSALLRLAAFQKQAQAAKASRATCRSLTIPSVRKQEAGPGRERVCVIEYPRARLRTATKPGIAVTESGSSPASKEGRWSPMSKRKNRKSEGERRNKSVETCQVQQPTSSPGLIGKLVEFAEAVVILRLLIELLTALNLG